MMKRNIKRRSMWRLFRARSVIHLWSVPPFVLRSIFAVFGAGTREKVQNGVAVKSLCQSFLPVGSPSES